ncbi:MAG: adenosine deaminase [Caulobacteraceae bacterium]|nr:adenosine deaminase [Caulobacteraceae bacterium]
MDLDRFIAGLPKAELHIHIEGSLEPEMMFAFARRNGVALPYADVEAVRRAYRFGNLQDFLDLYYQGADVLRTAEDFHDLALAYFRRAAGEGVAHAEIFFDPQAHTTRGLAFETVAEGLLAGMAQAERDLGVTSRLILCFLRHLSEEDAFKALRQAEPFLDRVAGVGLDSSEQGHPPAKFARVFAAAGERGLRRVAHAGEEGPPAYVAEALDLLHVDRIDHGNRALEDPALVERLAEEAIPLTVCPLSNLRLCVVSDLADHPIAQMLRLGLRATLNSDDPAYFGGYVNDNFRAVGAALSREDIVTLARNSFVASFLPPTQVAAHVARLDAYVAEAAAHG